MSETSSTHERLNAALAEPLTYTGGVTTREKDGFGIKLTDTNHTTQIELILTPDSRAFFRPVTLTIYKLLPNGRRYKVAKLLFLNGYDSHTISRLERGVEYKLSCSDKLG